MDKTLSDSRVVSSHGGGMCPEQHWGELTDGSVFYFRMRHGWAELHVGPPGTNEADLPLVNPAWKRDEAEAAYDAGREYVSFWHGPVGEFEAYPEDHLNGSFDNDADRDRAFTECLDQIWRDGRVVYGDEDLAARYLETGGREPTTEERAADRRFFGLEAGD